MRGRPVASLRRRSTRTSVLREAATQPLQLSKRELSWLDKIESAITGMPADEEELLEEMKETYGHLYAESSYGLA